MKILLLLSALVLPAFSVTADDKHSATKVTQSWARATPPGATTSAVYMTINNHTDTNVKLIEVNSNVTDRTEIHNTTNKDGMMQMRQIDAVDIAKMATVELRPNGMHVMLFDLKAPLEEGSAVNVELVFDNGKSLEIEVPVKKQAEDGDQSHKHKDHK